MSIIEQTKLPITTEEITIIRDTMTAARENRATLTMLAQAHEIAAKHDLSENVRELRRHIYDLIPTPREPIFTRKAVVLSIMMGLVSAIGVGLILKHTGLKEKLLD